MLINSEHYVYSDDLFESFQESSFQVVLISGRNFSFILMNYGDIAVTGHPVQVKYTSIFRTKCSLLFKSL